MNKSTGEAKKIKNQKIKFISLAFLLAGLMTVSVNMNVFGAKYADPSVEVYGVGTISEDSTTVIYRDESREEFGTDKKIMLLMLNGSFINAEIVIENDRSLVPIRVVSEKLNSKVDWDLGERAVIITTPSGRYANLKIGQTQAETDAGIIELDVAPTIKDSKTYVPLRLVADALNCEVDYRENLFETGVSAIIIEERYGYDPIYLEDEALVLVKHLSEEMQDQLMENPTSQAPDYDSQAISFAGEIGRYYIFTLENFEKFPILFDRYGGEIYSLKEGLPYLFISEGFINISWMFQ